MNSNEVNFALVLIGVFGLLSWTQSLKLAKETVVPEGCTCPSVIRNDDTRNWFFCGHELDERCSRYVVYKCRNGTITVRTDCPFNAANDRQITNAHYCSMSHRRDDIRLCAFIYQCTEALGLCGFPSLQAVNNETIKKITEKVTRRVYLHRLKEPTKCKWMTSL
jgi:hypothetical protein